MYRDRMASCPTCDVALVSAGSVRGCGTCRGVWVTEQVLTEMVWDLHHGAETELLVWQPRAGDTRKCPVCEQGMDVVTLEKLPVDRCKTHGVWLDAGELAATLENAALRKPRARGIKLDLSEDRGRGYESDAEREAKLRAWFSTAVAEVAEQTTGVERGIVEDAIGNLLAALRAQPATARPTPDCAIALHDHVEAAPADARYLRELKRFTDAWCVRYGMLAEHFVQLDLSGDAVREYFDALGAPIETLTEVFAPGDVLASHSRLLELLQRQREWLANAFDAARQHDRVDTERHLDGFYAAFCETEDAIAMLIARTTG